MFEPPLLSRLPYPVAYYLGYRKPGSKDKILPLWRLLLWSFIASWIGTAVIEIICTYSPSFKDHHSPIIIGSFGAGAVLVYGVPESPLSQPRNVFFGQLIGALSGVIVNELFMNINKSWASEDQRIIVEWVGGATAMALSLLFMQITKTLHAPGGATSVLAVTSLKEMRWFFILVTVISAVVQIAIGCAINNIERKYPVYWWKPETFPIEKDPVEISTLSPTPVHASEDDDKEKQDVNITINQAIEDILSDEEHTPFVLQKAMAYLQAHPTEAVNNGYHYALLTPGNPLIVTPGLLDNSERETLERLLNKISKS
ncbi:HPP family-domain-containing protein [Pilobolus umbonatus]|nr:HPP family-domain-containing protein [Pilobolus umbonatus]